MKGKDKLIGVIAGVVLSAVAASISLQFDEFKAGFCGQPAPVSQPSPVPAQ